LQVEKNALIAFKLKHKIIMIVLWCN